ncbi:MAG: bifunctional oligoribonuclease/PAP phosphatase NrnA [Desulfovibrionaceae bacterium]|nr:bifunctional oligoribonuclease/PAP phosphatase NrnA [Desulfovibrionaceae bacterium]
MDAPIRAVARTIKDNESFLVASHFNPDGDAIGSTAAMGHILKALGKKFALYNASGLPERFAWLDLPGPLLDALPSRAADPKVWLLALDCGSPARLGQDLAARMNPDRTVNIDHHLGNPEFGAVNWVDPAQASVGSMIADLARDLGLELKGPLAEAIYLALTTDTGFFTYGNTTPEALELAAALMRGGLDCQRLNQAIRDQWPERRLKLWSRVMARVRLELDGEVALAVVTAGDLKDTGTTVEDTENLVNFIHRLEGLRVAALLREDGPGTYKFSLRSRGEDDVQAVAAGFGGGGHKNAAGGSLRADLAAAEKRLLEALKQALRPH